MWKDIAASVLGAANVGTDLLNYGNQVANLKYMKWAQERTWSREDNSVQRRVADLKAAGMSPILAAGQGAATSAPIRLEAPKLESPGESMKIPLLLMSQKADIARTVADTERIRLEAEGQKLANQYAASANPLTLQKKSLETEVLERTIEDAIWKIKKDSATSSANAQISAANVEIKKNEITQSQLDLVSKVLKNSLDEMKISEIEKELIIKEVAIATGKYNLEKWQLYGLPTNAGLDYLTRGAGIVGGALGEVLGKIGGGTK